MNRRQLFRSLAGLLCLPVANALPKPSKGTWRYCTLNEPNDYVAGMAKIFTERRIAGLKFQIQQANGVWVDAGNSIQRYLDAHKVLEARA